MYLDNIRIFKKTIKHKNILLDNNGCFFNNYKCLKIPLLRIIMVIEILKSKGG